MLCVHVNGRSYRGSILGQTAQRMSSCGDAALTVSLFRKVGCWSYSIPLLRSQQTKKTWVGICAKENECTKQTSNSNSSERYELSSRPSTWKRIAQWKGKRAADPCQVDWTAREIGKGLGWRVVMASQVRALIGCLDAPF